MRTRVRIGPFTFGKTGSRLSMWKRGSGFSIPLFTKKGRTFGKIRLGIFSFYFNRKRKRHDQMTKKAQIAHPNAYAPWNPKDERELITLFRGGKSVKELSELFGRSKNAIRSRINKLLLQ